jgi:hypothetical protein
MASPTEIANWFSIVGTPISLIGLGVSVWTLVVARDARAAAEQTARIIRHKEAADGLREMSQLAKDLLSQVHCRERDLIVKGSTELISVLSFAIARWRDYITSDQMDSLLNGAELLGRVNRNISEKGLPDEQLQMRRLIESCQTIVKVIGTAAGEVLASAESGEYDHRRNL